MIGATLRRAASPQVAQWLWLASGLVLALLPALFVFAHRSSPLILSIAAALALLASGAEDRLAAVWTDLKRAWRNPVGLAAAAFLAWAALSIGWSEARGMSLFGLGELLLPIGAAMVLAVTLPGRMLRPAVGILTCAIAFGCVVVHFELATDSAWRRVLGARWDANIFNRPVLTFLLLSVPTLWFFVRTRQARAAALLAILLAGTILLAKSGAAVLGLIVGLATFWISRRVPPRRAVAIAGGVMLAALASAPVTGAILERAFPARLHEVMESASSRARVDIYRTFGAAVSLHPVAGAGFGVSTRYAQTSHAARLPPELQGMASIGHPHNAALQIWVELGLIGAVLAAAVLAFVLRGLAHLPLTRFAPRLTLLVGAAGIALVGHGAWQGWWAAALGATLVWLRCIERLIDETSPPLVARESVDDRL